MGENRRRELVELGGQVASQFNGQLAHTVRRHLAKRRDPREKQLRRRRRARRSTIFRTFLTGGLGGVTAGVATPWAWDVPDVLLGSATALAAVAAASAGLRMARVYREPLPEAVDPIPPLPPANSLAREPMQRLGNAEDSLHDLLGQLGGSGGHTAALSEASVSQASTTARKAAATLRSVAAKLTAVERAREAAPPLSRQSLVDDVRRLRAELDEGVDGYGQLVAAAGRAVAASATPADSAFGHRELLADAVEHLAGLASALGDLHRPSA